MIQHLDPLHTRIRRPRRAYAKLYGRRFGDLVALYPTEDRKGKRGSVLWVCACDCGLKAIRSAGYLQYSQKNGTVSCCQACFRELRRGYFQQAREGACAFFAAMFKKGYGLYGCEFSDVPTDERDDRDLIPTDWWELFSPGLGEDINPAPFTTYTVEGQWAGAQLRANGWRLLAGGVYQHPFVVGPQRLMSALRINHELLKKARAELHQEAA